MDQGWDPNNFYYKYIGEKKFYFFKSTNARISKSHLPEKIIDKIQEKDIHETIEDMRDAKNGHLKTISQLEEKIKELDEQIKKAEEESIDVNLFKTREDKKRKEREDKKEKAEWGKKKGKKKPHKPDPLEEFAKYFFSASQKAGSNTPPNFNNNNNTDPVKQKPKVDPKVVLNKYNIHTKKEWKSWLLENHMDKGGKHLEEVQEVIVAGKAMIW